MSKNKFMVAQLITTLVTAAIVLSFWGAIIWVGWHFVSKFW